MRYANYRGRGSALTAAIGVGFVVGISPGVVSADAPTADSVEYTSSNPTPGVGSAVISPRPAQAGGPMPLNGGYVLNWALDRQTYNGVPAPGLPFASKVSFDTTCEDSGCVAHSSLVAQGVPFDFRWTGAHWRAVYRFRWACGGELFPAIVSYTLTPNPNGTLSGERTATVGGPGCGTPRVPGVFVSPVTGAPA
jgi:hypothetical protein